MNKNYTCCFIGHRKTEETKELKGELFEIIENLIVEKKVDTFLFGSKSGTKIALDYAIKKKRKIILLS